MRQDSPAIALRCGLVGRIGLILLIVLASAAPAAAAISLVTSGSATGTNIGAGSAGSVTVTPPAATGGGNTVVIIIATKTTSVGLQAVQDSGGSIYILRADVTANGTSSRIRVYSTDPGESKNSTWIQANVNCCTGTDIVVAVASYSGVYSLGNTATLATNSST